MARIALSPNPSVIGAKLAKRVALAQAAVEAQAKTHAARGQAAMQANAPWGDRSGEARAGLFGDAEGTTMVLGGTVPYQPYLEVGTSRAAARPIIAPTFGEEAPAYIADAAKAIKDALG